MLESAVKLVDLIEYGRAARLNAPTGTSTSSDGALVALGIERLATDLISISRVRGTTPAAQLREALRSIENCLVVMRELS